MTIYALSDAQWAREARRRRLVDRPSPKRWKFNIGDKVSIWHSGGPQVATIKGRAEFDDKPDAYYVEFITRGCVVRQRLPVTSIMPCPPAPYSTRP